MSINLTKSDHNAQRRKENLDVWFSDRTQPFNMYSQEPEVVKVTYIWFSTARAGPESLEAQDHLVKILKIWGPKKFFFTNWGPIYI